MLRTFHDRLWLLQGKQPQEMWPEKWGLCRLIIFCAWLVALWICSLCCCLASALNSSAFLCTTAILFINFSSRFDLIFCTFTYKPYTLIYWPNCQSKHACVQHNLALQMKFKLQKQRKLVPSSLILDIFRKNKKPSFLTHLNTQIPQFPMDF